MTSSFDRAPLMAQTYPLPRGPRVRLRLATARDEAPIRALLERCGTDYEQSDIVQLVRFDPRRRAVIGATTLLSFGEAVVGVGSIDLDGSRLEMLCVDHHLTDGLGDLLVQALKGRVNALRGPRAA